MQTVKITLTEAGTDTGPFNLYSNIDGFLVPFESSVAKLDLVAGYTSFLVPDSTIVIRVQSTSVSCSNYTDLDISAPTTTTTTTTSTPVNYTISGSVNTTVNTANALEQEITLTISPTPASGVIVTSTFNWGLSSTVTDSGICSATAFLEEPDLTTETCLQNCSDFGTFTAVFTNASPTELVRKRGDVTAGGITETSTADVSTSYASSVISGGSGTVGATGSAFSHLLSISFTS